MKVLTYILSLSLIIASINVNAQIAETEATMSDGTQAALIVETDLKKKDAEKLFKNYVKKIGKVDWDRKSREHVLFDKIIKDIDRDNPVTVISKFEDNKATFWFKQGDTYLNSDDNQEALKGAGKWLQQYAYDVEKKSIEVVLGSEEKELSNLEKDLKKLQKQNDKLHNEIEKAQKKIAEAEANIEQNLKDQEAKAKEISDQKDQVSKTKKDISNIGKN